jgi:hypothetical protein
MMTFKDGDRVFDSGSLNPGCKRTKEARELFREELSVPDCFMLKREEVLGDHATLCDCAKGVVRQFWPKNIRLEEPDNDFQAEHSPLLQRYLDQDQGGAFHSLGNN